MAVFMHWHKSLCPSCASAYSGNIVYMYLGAVFGEGGGSGTVNHIREQNR